MPENASASKKRDASANLNPRASKKIERDPCAGTVSIAPIVRDRNEPPILSGVNCPQKGENCARQKRKICFHIAMQSTVLLPTLTVVRCPCCTARFHEKVQCSTGISQRLMSAEVLLIAWLYESIFFSFVERNFHLFGDNSHQRE